MRLIFIIIGQQGQGIIANNLDIRTKIQGQGSNKNKTNDKLKEHFIFIVIPTVGGCILQVRLYKEMLDFILQNLLN